MTHTSTTAPAATQWRKSSYSGGGNQCVEVAHLGPAIAVRDSKNPDVGHLAFSATDWRAFLAQAKHGSYDL